jgi:hypothetical protein
MTVYVLIKSYQNKWVILGQELTENDLKNREFGHNARSATSRFGLAAISSANALLHSQTSTDHQIINSCPITVNHTSF